MSECTRCQGTGWANAARDSGMEDMPLMLRPIGVYRCANCGGTGDTDPFAHLTDEQRAELDTAIKQAWEKVGARKTETEGHNALGEGRERGILREASSGEAATSTDGLGGAVPRVPTFGEQI